MIDLTITAADKYVTAYQDGKPVATMQRRGVYEQGPIWKCFGTDGTLLFVSHLGGSSRYFAKRIGAALGIIA